MEMENTDVEQSESKHLDNESESKNPDMEDSKVLDAPVIPISQERQTTQKTLPNTDSHAGDNLTRSSDDTDKSKYTSKKDGLSCIRTEYQETRTSTEQQPPTLISPTAANLSPRYSSALPPSQKHSAYTAFSPSPPIHPSKKNNQSNAQKNNKHVAKQLPVNNINLANAISHSTNNSSSTSDSPRSHVSMSKLRRARRIQRSNSAPLNAEPFANNNKDVTTSAGVNIVDTNNNDIETLLLSNEVLAIPARRRSISTHSGGSENVTFETIVNQLETEERERAKKKEMKRRKHRSLGSYDYQNMFNFSRKRLGTDTSEITLEGIGESDGQHDFDMILKKEVMAGENDSLFSLKEEEEEDNNNELEKIGTKTISNLSMQNYLTSAIGLEKGGGDVEVDDAPEALKAAVPAGVILVNRADPRSSSMINQFSSGADVSDDSSSPVLSDFEAMGLSTDEGGIKAANDEIQQSMIYDEDETKSDGSLFDDTIGLEKFGKNDMVKDSLEMFYSGSSASGHVATPMSPVDDSLYIGGQENKLPEYPIRRHDLKKKRRSPPSSKNSKRDKLSKDNHHMANRKIRPNMVETTRRKKKTSPRKAMERTATASVNIDGFEYNKADQYRISDDNNTRGGKSRTSKSDSRLGRNKQSPYDDSDDSHGELRYLMNDNEGVMDTQNRYGSVNSNAHRVQKIRMQNPLNYYRPVLSEKKNKSSQKYAPSSSNRHHVPDVVTLGSERRYSYDIERGYYYEPRYERRRKKRHKRIDSLMDSVFSSVRSASTGDIEADCLDSERYCDSGVIERSFPERFFALLVTLIVEIPVFLMIVGGGDKLCNRMGRNKYQLMLAYLPLICAISGNCGLQSSTLTTRAISHCHVTKLTFKQWSYVEVATSATLGITMGFFLGIFAYQASGKDFAFGVCVGCTQFISVVVAGLTGSLSPIISSIFFHQDSGKWNGLLETAIQDVVGCFAAVSVFYFVFEYMVEVDIESFDKCLSNTTSISSHT